MSKELINRIKNKILSGNYSLCDNRWWCPLEDGYCPCYSCVMLDKVRAYTDRQWDNAIKYAKKMYGDDVVNNVEFIDVLLNEYLLGKRPRGKNNE